MLRALLLVLCGVVLFKHYPVPDVALLVRGSCRGVRYAPLVCNTFSQFSPLERAHDVRHLGIVLLTNFVHTSALYLQAAAEERRLEARLSKMREGQMATVSEVVTTAEVTGGTPCRKIYCFCNGCR